TYDINALGQRVRDVGATPDPDRPTVILNGESVGFGHGLAYGSTLAGILERELGVQVVNLSVHGYGNAQEYLRLMDELPLYSHVAGVVTLVCPEQTPRDISPAEPHLVIGDDGKPRLGPPRTDLRLARLVRGEPYRGDDAVEFTRDLLRAQAAE